jgi:multidrug efflux pump subunit AcrB
VGIVRFALRFPHTFYVVAALILFLGVTAAVEMPTDIFPEINIPVVTVIWQYTGLDTTQMEQRFTTYSQYAISSNVNGIRNIEAETVNGISVQKLYFQPDVNLDLAISQVVAATNATRALLPVGTQPPVVVQYSASAGIVNLSNRGMLQESVAGGARSVNPERACCPAPESGDREEEGGLSSLT